MSKAVINANRSKGVINRNIYGQFAEHLGRCIYNGVYVGEGSGIPNENGMRTDVVQALRALRIPVLRWPGGCLADPYPWQDGICRRGCRQKQVRTHQGGAPGAPALRRQGLWRRGPAGGAPATPGPPGSRRPPWRGSPFPPSRPWRSGATPPCGRSSWRRSTTGLLYKSPSPRDGPPYP